MAVTKKQKTDRVTQAELGRRLRAARECRGLTQQQTADAMGVPQTVVDQIEAGSRTVSSLDLARLAHLYRRKIGEFLREHPADEGPSTALFRTGASPAEEPILLDELHRCVSLCRELTEQVLALGIGAYRRGEISRNKLQEIAAEAGLARENVEAALVQADVRPEPVDVIFPE